MANFIEYIADDSLLSQTVFDLVAGQLSLRDEERTPDTSLSGWNDLFNVHTHSHDNPDRPDLNTVVSLRIRDQSLWDECKLQSVELLNSILRSTDSDLEFYSFFHLKCYRRNGGINICKPNGLPNHQQFWNDRLQRILALNYNVVAKEYCRF